jgi:uncharacterized delta-60 repeat protein
VTVNGAITDALFTGAANGSVFAMAVQGDGKIVLGGGFSSFRGQPQSSIVRIHPDGTVDASFTGGVSNGFVNCLTLQPDGRILVGGTFTNISGAARTNLARLNSDGTVDATFNALAGTSSNVEYVKSLVVQTDGKIVVGGGFVRLAGQVRTNLGRLNTNGTLDTTFTASGGGGPFWVETLALQPDGRILVGGRFDFLNGVRRTSIGRLLATGGLDTTFNPGANSNSIVRSLAVQADGMILAGGTFSQMGGQEQKALARLNSSGTLDTNFNADLEMTTIGTLGVNSIAVQVDGKILLGGTFTRFSGTTRNFFGRLTTTGEPDVTFNVGFNGPVRGVTIQPDGKILVGQSGIFRINNTAPASETLYFIGSTISWLRSGTGPEVVHAFFEYSTNGVNWMNLGLATRVANGWQKTNVPVQPANGVLRARGYVRGSDNSASGWFTEKYIYRGKPVILAQPVSRTNVVGTAAVFTVQAGGTEPLSYRWRRDGVDLTDGGKLSGVFSNVLTLTDTQVGDAAGFDVVVTNVSGSVTSSVASLSVLILEGYNRITGVPLGDGLHLLQFVGQPGASYVLERTFNLRPPVGWIPQSTNQAAELGLLNFTNTAVGSTNNFWRVRLRP